MAAEQMVQQSTPIIPMFLSGTRKLKRNPHNRADYKIDSPRSICPTLTQRQTAGKHRGIIHVVCALSREINLSITSVVHCRDNVVRRSIKSAAPCLQRADQPAQGRSKVKQLTTGTELIATDRAVIYATRRVDYRRSSLVACQEKKRLSGVNVKIVNHYTDCVNHKYQYH